MSSTPVPVQPAAVVPFDPSNIPSNLGLEDFDASDATIPRINLDHKQGAFRNNLTNETTDSLDLVVLGLVKQRVLWAVDVDEADGPLCKSLDHEHGRPYIKEFPWQATTFDAATVDADNPTLDCSLCPLKEWGSHPTRETPWCSEQFVFIVVTASGPALITFQRSAVKAVRAYLSSFAQSGTPPFTVRTKIELQHQKRGSVEFSVPVFTKGEATAEDEWPEYAQEYLRIRAFIQTSRVRDGEGTGSSPAAPSTPPAAPPASPPAAAPAPQPEASAPAPAQDDDDGDLPF